MQSVLVYLIKVIACSGIFFLYYLLALRNKKFHPYNRFYLIATAVLSCIIPMLQISMFDVNSNNDKVIKLMQLMYGGNLKDVTIGTEANANLDLPHIILFVSLAITLLLLILTSIKILTIHRLKKSFPSTRIDEINFINTDIQSAPFSFFRNLFWRKDIELDDETGAQIFRHEMAHIEQKHSWDKLFFQILKAVFWMNPVFYFMNSELTLIHEFIADEKAVKNGDGEAFARMLLLTQVGKFAFEPAHPFFYSTIKKRLKMITNSQKTKFSYLRRLMVLPLLGIISFAFAFRAHRMESKKTGASLDHMIAVLKLKLHSDSLQYHALSDTVYINTPKQDTLKKKPLYILDGVPLKEEKYTTLSPDSIASISVLKDTLATSLYGVKGRIGVIIITSKHDNINHVFDTAKTKLFVRGINGAEPLYIINGKIASKELLDKIDPSDIASVSVLKDAVATSMFGNEAKNGVIKITTKDALKYYTKIDSPAKIKATYIAFSSKNEKKPIIVVGRSSPINRDVIVVRDSNKIFFRKDTLPEVVVVGYGNREKDHTIEFTSVQHEAEFPGGSAAWVNYLKSNLRQDVPLKHHAPAGQYPVTVSFLIDKSGEISEVKVIKAPNPDYGTSEEAVRVIYNSGKWKPAIQNGHPVAYRQKQRIIFTVSK
ncbi:MAG: TonB-dependent receptor plug domain-containing protein [Arachidicoccus sp.]|nr:TonB-dependent receptor plug domain-containing protein [Arachidicoccus sp.]